MNTSTTRNPASKSVWARVSSLALAMAIGGGWAMAWEAHAVEVLPHSAGGNPGQKDPAPYAAEGLIPGDWVVQGRVERVAGGHIEVNIGNPQPLFLPLKPAVDKGFQPNTGDILEIVLNDHNAIVDFHPVDRKTSRLIIRGQIAEPLTVGMDKATIRSGDGEQSFVVASRARSKISAIPLETEAIFLVDETNQIVDGQLLSAESVSQSAQNQKPPVKGAHRRIEALYLGQSGPDQVRIQTRRDGKERVLPIRPPLEKLSRLKDRQETTLLVDAEGYITEIATPDVVVR